MTAEQPENTLIKREILDPEEMLGEIIRDIYNEREALNREDNILCNTATNKSFEYENSLKRKKQQKEIGVQIEISQNEKSLAEYEAKLEKLMEDYKNDHREVENLRNIISSFKEKRSELEQEVSRLKGLNNQYTKQKEGAVPQFSRLDQEICLEDGVRTLVRSALPSLSAERAAHLVGVIMKEQPDDLRDLRFFVEEDFVGELTKIQARKLMHFIKQMSVSGTISPVEAQDQTLQILSVSRTTPQPVTCSIEPEETQDQPLPDLSVCQEPPTRITEPEKIPDQSPQISKVCRVPPQPTSCSLELEPVPLSTDVWGVATNWFEDFQIPSHKFPTDILKKCREGSRLHPTERKLVIRILASEVSVFCKRPGKKNLEFISAKLVKEFPQTFRDEIFPGEVVGSGYHSVLSALMARFENQNRGKPDSLKRLIPQLKRTDKKRRKRCSVNQPDYLPENETRETQLRKKTWLQKEFKKETRNSEEVARLNKLTFPSQRLDINTMKLVRDVRKQWPFLTEVPYLVQHFLMAMEPVSPNWSAVLQQKVPELLAYLKTKLKPSVVLKCDALQALLMLCGYFKEENDIVKIFQESDLAIDVVNNDRDIPITPFIAVFGTKSNTSMVFIEKEPYTTYIVPEDAFMVWFLSYFVFNLKYPKKNIVTLDFVQSVLFGVPKNSYNSESRITRRSIKLMKEICNFRSQLKELNVPL